MTILGEAARRPVCPHARTDGREPRRRLLGRHGGRGRHRLLPGPRRRPPGGDRCRGPLYRRGIHRRLVRGARSPARQGADRHQLFQQPHVAGPGRAGGSAFLPLGGGRGQRGRLPCLPTRRSLAARATADRFIPRVGLVRDSFVGMALAPGCDGRARTADRRDGRCPAPLRDREDQDRAWRRKRFPPHLTRSNRISATRPPTAWMDCDWIGRAAGSWSAAAIRSRSSARLPRPRRPRRPGGFATRRRRC